MVRITQELIRKRSEHNEGEISTLEEISLHQENIEKIELLQDWCRNLQILLLQGNLISKIENLNKLKCLQYLNLALNNIEKIENLEGCESLQKLDLTLNFIGDIKSICSLAENYNLHELYLTGNPCVDYKGYREYVITKLPQIKSLDCKDVTRSERIQALQAMPEIETNIFKEESAYFVRRREQKERLTKNTQEVSNEDFWKQKSENAPETRIEIAERERKQRENISEKPKPKKPRKLFADDGRPLNINEARIPFVFKDHERGLYELEISVYKYLDTSLIDVDLHPTYVRVMVKEKMFQLVFPEEVCVDKSTAQRSQTTGHLVIKMPVEGFNKNTSHEKIPTIKNEKKQYLEVSEPISYKKIVKHPPEDVDDIPELI